MSRHSLCAFGLIVIISGIASGEYYSSVHSMQLLGDVEYQLLYMTRAYLEEQQQQLVAYRNFLDRVKREHSAAIENLKDYLGHPLHAYALLKRMVKDWDDLHGLMAANKPREDYIQEVEKLVTSYSLPDQADLRGAVKGLVRLQQVYNLSAVDLADGKFNVDNFDASILQWQDCFEVAVQLYELRDFERAVDWISITANLIMELPVEDPTDKQKHLLELLEYQSLANFELGNEQLAHKLLHQVLKLKPEHPAQHTLNYMELNKSPVLVQEEEADWFANYSSLCQGRRLPEIRTTSLRCFLDGQRHAAFTLAPLKVEQLNLDPDINLYHGLLNDAQIENILNLANELRMQRSAVNSNDGGSVVREIRVSQQVWLDYTDPMMLTIKNMVEGISGFDLSNAEKMQMANYGVGGQYEPHPDYHTDNLPKAYLGNRISTSMFYLSNVEQGGYTVFTKLNIFLPPVKGAMVMWHNLHRSLDVDQRTVHAGCPVLVGSKRIGNIWTHSGYQEFRRPCELSSDSYKSHQDYSTK